MCRAFSDKDEPGARLQSQSRFLLRTEALLLLRPSTGVSDHAAGVPHRYRVGGKACLDYCFSILHLFTPVPCSGELQIEAPVHDNQKRRKGSKGSGGDWETATIRINRIQLEQDSGTATLLLHWASIRVASTSCCDSSHPFLSCRDLVGLCPHQARACTMRVPG